ncbi:hypothetical protein [Halomarina pelagica]|uniref:hypothetical protein n=1 Tax=Halomarina pelagica TaxID=2961599 RepID=UPI0020C31B97|nr:hypothetical protein [Halomarina sp. BND7]
MPRSIDRFTRVIAALGGGAAATVVASYPLARLFGTVGLAAVALAYAGFAAAIFLALTALSRPYEGERPRVARAIDAFYDVSSAAFLATLLVWSLYGVLQVLVDDPVLAFPNVARSLLIVLCVATVVIYVALYRLPSRRSA